MEDVVDLGVEVDVVVISMSFTSFGDRLRASSCRRYEIGMTGIMVVINGVISSFVDVALLLVFGSLVGWRLAGTGAQVLVGQCF